MARHALVDLAQIFSLGPVNDAPNRLPPERCQQLFDVLCQSGVGFCGDPSFRERLQQMRGLYEGYAEALSRYLAMPLPDWLTDQPHKDNWQTVARLRAQTEAAGSRAAGHEKPPAGPVSNIPAQIDHHHDF